METITGFHYRKKPSLPRITVTTDDNFAKSMPNISDTNDLFHPNNNTCRDNNNLMRLDGGFARGKINNYHRNYHSDDSFDESDENFESEPYKFKRQSGKKRSVSESVSNNLSSQREAASIIRASCKNTQYKKKDISPTDVLKNKFKLSLSLHNLNAENERTYDKYHTVHGNFDTSCYEAAGFCLKDKFQNDEKDNLMNESNFKCCCGKRNCATVVPLQQYLEVYFKKMVREFYHLQNNCSYYIYTSGRVL